MISLYVCYKIFQSHFGSCSAFIRLSLGLLTLSIFFAGFYSQAQDHQSSVSTLSIPPVSIVEDDEPQKKATDENSPVQEPSDKNQNQEHIPKAEVSACESYIVNKDLEDRYDKLRAQMEKDYQSGVPHQIKSELVNVRKQVDQLMAKLFELDSSNSQEVNHITLQTISHLETMISLIPKANRMAPKVLDHYMVPFTNISSLKAEHQECLMKAAIEEAKSQNQKSMASNESSFNVYRNLSEQLQEMNKNLYRLQTSDVGHFIGLRAQLIKNLEDFNKQPPGTVNITSNIPTVLNAVHTEIEKLIPGLELPEKYYTLAR